jgi:hypothetical protein
VSGQESQSGYTPPVNREDTLGALPERQAEAVACQHVLLGGPLRDVAACEEVRTAHRRWKKDTKKSINSHKRVGQAYISKMV